MGPDAIAEVGTTVPLSRPVTGEEIARVVAFVASPRPSYVTGAIYAADGAALPSRRRTHLHA